MTKKRLSEMAEYMEACALIARNGADIHSGSKELREHADMVTAIANYLSSAVEPSAPYIVNPGWTCPKCGLTAAGHIQRECDWKPAEFAQGPALNREGKHE